MGGKRRDFGALEVAAGYAELLCALVEKRGIARSSLLAGSGVTAELLASPGARVTSPQFQRIVRRALELTGDPSLGFQLGLTMNIKTHGFLGYAALSSESIAEAIDLATRYFRTRTTGIDLLFFVEGDTAVLQFDECYPMGDLLPFAIETLLGMFHTIRLQLVQDEIPADGEARVTYPEQEYHRLLAPLIGGRIRFNCSANQIRFPASELQKRINYADPQLVRMAAAQCEEELKKLKDESGLLGEVRRRVRRRLADDPSLEGIAGELHMAPRTLRRRLAELGTSYHDVVEQLRRGLAVEYLQAGDRPVEHIAELLGYSDPSNFGRAFRRWTGMSPTAWRAQAVTPLKAG
ncbi:MAG: AraC family transcriptional regulator [Pseudomonadota bacterium]